MFNKASQDATLRIPCRDKFLLEVYSLLWIKKNGQEIAKGYDFAARIHAQDRRRSGEKYMCHIEDVARRYIAIRRATKESIGIDDIIDLFIHDTVEMHPDCEEDFRKSFWNQAFDRQALFSKPDVPSIPMVMPFSPEWWNTIKECLLFPIQIKSVIKENPYILVTLWTKYATYNTTTKDIQEFLYACRILSYDERTFEKKCADQVSNLHDILDVLPKIGDAEEVLEKKKLRNDAMIFTAEKVYTLKAEVLWRKDLVALIREWISLRHNVVIQIHEALVKLRVAKNAKETVSSPASSLSS